jgi:hypothetical protein
LVTIGTGGFLAAALVIGGLGVLVVLKLMRYQGLPLHLRWRSGQGRRIPLAWWAGALPFYFVGHVLSPANVWVADAFPWGYLILLQTIELFWWVQSHRRRQRSAG